MKKIKDVVGIILLLGIFMLGGFIAPMEAKESWNASAQMD